MHSSRVVKNILRRLSSGETLCTPLNSTNLHLATHLKLLDSDTLTRNKRLLPSVANSFQVRTMATSSCHHSENRLASEKSPYLLQHATNPVDWYPWCEEAFEKAKRENKLIFLSVGYSTCHWCHVMEKESFENDSVAEIMNRYYINIKVDREERPDIDKVYMSFIQATSGSGGWPMSVFLTPDLEPITGGTYFPPEDKWGRPGFKTILNNIAEKWDTEKESIAQSGKHVLEILKRASEKTNSSEETSPPGLQCVQRCLQQYNKSYEPDFGGFSDSPKFPQPSNFDFLFHVYSRDTNSTTEKQCLNMCLHTLKRMAYGGIHDHVSNGFARYSTDSRWHVPHFEKMLYDQGQLAVSYCNAYLATKDPFYADVVRDILLYVSRDLSHESGGFYSAEDADSFPTEGATHKKEGAFCVWEFDEIIKHLTGRTGNVSDAEIFCYHFNVKKAGNVHPSQDPHHELTNKNVLITHGGIESTAEFFEMPPEQIKESIDKSLKILYEIRQTRPRPHLDSKMLTAWNGLMITGFAKAGEVLNDESYTERAIKAANFVKKYLYNDNEKTLLRCCYRGTDGHIAQNSTSIVGFLDDYAFLIRALVDLYEATLDSSWLVWAEDLQDSQDRLFWDTDNAGYFTSPAGDPTVLIRVKDVILAISISLYEFRINADEVQQLEDALTCLRGVKCLADCLDPVCLKVVFAGISQPFCVSNDCCYGYYIQHCEATFNQDGAEPSGNSVSAHNLLRLSAYLDRPTMRTQAERLLASFSERLQKIPIAIPEMMSALLLYHDSLTNVLIVGPRTDAATLALLQVVRTRLMPGRALVLADGPDGPSSLLYSRIDILSKLKKLGGKPTAYVCHHHACSLPVTEPQDLLGLLEEDLVGQRQQWSSE